MQARAAVQRDPKHATQRHARPIGSGWIAIVGSGLVLWVVTVHSDEF